MIGMSVEVCYVTIHTVVVIAAARTTAATRGEIKVETTQIKVISSSSSSPFLNMSFRLIFF